MCLVISISIKFLIFDSNMNNDNPTAIVNQPQYYRLKISQKKILVNNSFVLEFEVPDHLKPEFQFQSGQYVTLKYIDNDTEITDDYSLTTAPFENKLAVAIKINSDKSPTKTLLENYNIGDEISVSTPTGRFFFPERPNEKRTIIAFAAGIGITPIISHIKNLLHEEKLTRIFLFYGNKNHKDIIFKDELHALIEEYSDRFQVYYFISQEKINNLLFQGRIDEKKVQLIINQILHLDEEDEESTIWDSTDKILICGPGEMIKSVANACYNNGILKKNIHFELFQSFNDDIYPQEKEFPLIENVLVKIKSNHLTTENILLKNNERKILQQLLDLGYNLPYSCKSGVCGSCICKLQTGKVEMEENEYLTENELQQGKILPCSAIAMSKELFLDFDLL